MTKKQAESIFKAEVLPALNRSDLPMVREAWNNFTDYLCKDRQISENQYNNWMHPAFVK